MPSKHQVRGSNPLGRAIGSGIFVTNYFNSRGPLHEIKFQFYVVAWRTNLPFELFSARDKI